jgi:hypothetical protein
MPILSTQQSAISIQPKKNGLLLFGLADYGLRSAFHLCRVVSVVDFPLPLPIS